MGWLVAWDVIPRWTAVAPPPLKATEWLESDQSRSQYDLRDEIGLLGSVWTTFLVDERSLRREDTVWIKRSHGPIPPLRIQAISVFTADGLMDEFTLRIAADGHRLVLHGERFHDDFSFTLDHNTVTQRFKLPLTGAGLVAGAFNPVSGLSGLKVGQRWRMQVFNPIAALTGIGDRFIPMLVEVVEEQLINTAQGPQSCLVVKTSGTTAWVDQHGVVQRQEITLPMLGTVRMEKLDEFDDDGLALARRERFTR